MAAELTNTITETFAAVYILVATNEEDGNRFIVSIAPADNASVDAVIAANTANKSLENRCDIDQMHNGICFRDAETLMIALEEARNAAYPHLWFDTAIIRTPDGTPEPRVWELAAALKGEAYTIVF